MFGENISFMQKILFIHYSGYLKERWGRTFPLAKAAAKCGYDVTLLTSNPKKGITYTKSIQDKVKIILYKDIVPSYLLFNKGYGFFSFFARIIHVLFHRYDYVYIDCGECPNAGWPGKIAQWKGATLLSEWGDLLGKGGYYDKKPKLFKFCYGWYYLWAEIYFRKTANYTIVLSSFMKEHALKMGVNENQIITVPGGALSNIIKYGYTPKNILSIPPNIITLGYIGIDEAEIKDLLPLINTLKKEHFINKFKLIVFGNKLKTQTILKYGLTNIIVEGGWLNYYHDYKKAQCVDIFVLMKSNNIMRNSMGWPNKLGDYMAFGRPIIITLYGDVKAFVEKNSYGFITTSSTEKNIEQILHNILQNKYNLKEMGRINRKIAEEEISWENRFKKLMKQVNNHP